MKNREVVKSVAKCYLLLAKQNLPFRSHRDVSQYLNMEGINLGDLQELLKYHCKFGDSCLKPHFEKANKNVHYRSNTIQNQNIHIIVGQILIGIIVNVKTAKYFALSADEAN